MHQFFQQSSRRRRPSTSAPAPAGTRLLSILCVLLLLFASTAQAAHIHGVARDTASHRVHAPAPDSQGTAGEEHCPLCVAMHGVLPAGELATAPLPSPDKPVRVGLRVERGRSPTWTYARFGRPPPASRP